NLICARQAGIVGRHVMHPFFSSELAIFCADDRSYHRLVLAPVTRVAGYFSMTIKAIFINSEHHSHHLARGLLGFLVVVFKGAFQMTEIALHAQRGGDELHGWNELVRWNSFEYLDVLVNLLSSRSRSTRRTSSRLSPQRSRTGEKKDTGQTCAC